MSSIALEARETVEPPAARAAWEELIRRFGAGLRARVYLALRRVGSRPRGDEVEELVQEVYCRLLAGGCRRLGACRGRGDKVMGAYLGRVAERVVYDQVRAARALKRGGRCVLEQGVVGEDLAERAVDPGATPEEALLGEERLRLFLESCGALAGPRDRRRNARILALVLLGGWSSAEIARAARGKLSARSIESLVHRTRSRLIAGRRPEG
jgi:DNA-directed RNA polymerase specialized sigma24 family protein